MDSKKSEKNLILDGISVSNGIGIGEINIYHTDFDDISEYTLETTKIVDELERYLAAVNEVDLIFLSNQQRVARDLGTKHAEIYDTYHMIIEDPFFQEEIPDTIKSECKNAEAVIRKKLSLYEKHFANVKDEYLRERIFDIRGVSRRLIFHLLQHGVADELNNNNKSNLIFAKELTPADSIHFHHRMLKGIVTEFGGKTSHAAILARSIEVPAIVGVSNLLKQVNNGDTAIVDATAGKLIIRPDKAVLSEYNDKRKQYLTRRNKLKKFVKQPLTMLGDRKIQLQANINETSEIDLAHKYNAGGVGLFRTELSFIAKEAFLSENEQFRIYRNVLEKFPGQEVVIRVLDLGGDKFLPFTELHRELNPFLGWRSIRILLSEVEIFKTQLRAIIKASHYGNAKIMIPMISSLEEIIAAKKIINGVKNDLRRENVPFNENIPVGIMVEIPSAALLIEMLINEIDFVSIGTNDLIQYTLAVDRNNEKVAEFYQPLNPAILYLIHFVAKAGARFNKPVSVCGEMAGDPLYTQLLLSLGINTLSMQPSSIPMIKNILLHTKPELLAEIAERVFTFNEVINLREYLYSHIESML
ncbi:MAG: phosphoenolpyruvate--protein phosphotransferase [Calditrichaceae bacterium]